MHHNENKVAISQPIRTVVITSQKKSLCNSCLHEESSEADDGKTPSRISARAKAVRAT